MGRSYRDYDRDSFKKKLRKCDWESLHDLENPDLVWDYILNKVNSILNQMCPLRKFSIKNYRPEWVTPELLVQIKDRDYIYKKAKQTGNQDDWKIAKHLRNTTNANIRLAKKEFILEELEMYKSDYKKFWKSIQSVIPDEKGGTRQDIQLNDRNDKVKSEDVAHFINDYFINIGKSSSANHLPKPVNPVESRAGRHNNSEQLWSLSVFTEVEVYKVIQSINISKSSRIENVSNFIIKEVFSILITEITYLFNLSVGKSIFPEAWKDALVIPIPKTGNLSKVQNYRPISLLPLPGKLLEKLIHNQISMYLELNNLLVDEQHGFRKDPLYRTFSSTVDKIY